jgi:hypothetical protein
LVYEIISGDPEATAVSWKNLTQQLLEDAIEDNGEEEVNDWDLSSEEVAERMAHCEINVHGEDEKVKDWVLV